MFCGEPEFDTSPFLVCHSGDSPSEKLFTFWIDEVLSAEHRPCFVTGSLFRPGASDEAGRFGGGPPWRIVHDRRAGPACP